VPADVYEYLAWLADEPAAAAPPRAAEAVSREDAEAWDRSVERERNEDLEGALRELAPLAEARPRHPAVHRRLCRLRHEARQEEAAATCAHAAELAPDAHDVRLVEALAWLRAGSRAEALAAALDGQARLDRQGEAAKPEQRLWLAKVLASLDALTLAEAALDRAGAGSEAADLRARLLRTRRRLGLPPGAARFGIPPEAEPSHVERLEAVTRELEAGGSSEALRAADALVAAHPGAPGPLALRCEACALLRRTTAARKACAAALKAWDESLRAHYYAGQVDLREGRSKAGIGHLERALELDPATKAVWHTLGQALRHFRKGRALDDLRRRYRERFGEALP